MDRLVSLVLLAACGGSVELGAPNDPPEWPMSSAVAHPPAPDAAPADPEVPSGLEASAEPAVEVTEPPAPAPESPPAEEPPETE